MTTLKERRLYQQTILERSRKPRHFGHTEPIDLSHKLVNPYCDDSIEITIGLNEQGDRLEEIKFQGSGCALCLAAADLAVETVKGKTINETQQIIEHFEEVMLGEAELKPVYRRLKAIEGAKRYPAKIKCVTLAWHALKAAISSREMVKVTNI